MGGLVLVASLIVGTTSAVLLVARSVSLGLEMTPPDVSRVAPTNELERGSRGGQLFSDGRSFFWRYLARSIEYQPNQEGQKPARNSLRRSRKR